MVERTPDSTAMFFQRRSMSSKELSNSASYKDMARPTLSKSPSYKELLSRARVCKAVTQGEMGELPVSLPTPPKPV